MGKEIKVVCGLIYDDEFHARTGGTRFYHQKCKIYRKTFVGISVREKQLCILNQ